MSGFISSMPTILVLVALLASPSLCNASAKNLRHAQPSDGLINQEDVRTSLLQEIEGALGSGVAARRLGRMEEALTPMFASMPKNQHGNLDHSVVRYALHRFFVQKHGWNFKGLEPSSASSANASSSAGMLKDRVPSYIQGLIEERLGAERGIGMHELAVLAATLEHLVHDEAVGRLRAAYASRHMSLVERLDEKQALEVVVAYMVSFILGMDLESMTPRRLEQDAKSVLEVYPGWPDTIIFVQDTLRSVQYVEQDRRNPFVRQGLDFEAVSRVIEEIGDRFGRFQDLECRQMKDTLLEMEEPGTGRVRLARFYKTALDGDFMFQESADYLREIGALDESDARAIRVVVPNYITSPSNCLATSSFFSVCCMDECEGLMGHLERTVQAPSAHPRTISSLVAKLSSSTVDAPRNLSAALLDRLDVIAASHGGEVQLHGRLFAQWMHHAFPRECPYPSRSSTSTSTPFLHTAEENSMGASKEEMERHATLEALVYLPTEDGADSVPWSEEEVLLAPIARADVPNSKSSILRSVVMLAAVGAMLRSMQKAWRASRNAKYDKFSKLI